MNEEGKNEEGNVDLTKLTTGQLEMELKRRKSSKKEVRSLQAAVAKLQKRISTLDSRITALGEERRSIDAQIASKRVEIQRLAGPDGGSLEQLTASRAAIPATHRSSRLGIDVGAMADEIRAELSKGGKGEISHQEMAGLLKAKHPDINADKLRRMYFSLNVPRIKARGVCCKGGIWRLIGAVPPSPEPQATGGSPKPVEEHEKDEPPKSKAEKDESVIAALAVVLKSNQDVTGGMPLDEAIGKVGNEARQKSVGIFTEAQVEKILRNQENAGAMSRHGIVFEDGICRLAGSGKGGAAKKPEGRPLRKGAGRPKKTSRRH